MTDTEPPLATGPEVYAYLGKHFNVHPHTIERWVRDGNGPPCIKTPGGHRRYQWADVDTFVDEWRRSDQPSNDPR